MTLKNAISAMVLAAVSACGGGDPQIPEAQLPVVYDHESHVHTPASAMVLGTLTIYLPGPKVFVPSNSVRSHMFLTIDHLQTANAVLFEIVQVDFDVIDRLSGRVVYHGSEPRARTGRVTQVVLRYGPTLDLTPGDYDLFVRLTVKAFDEGGQRQVPGLGDADSKSSWRITID